MLDADAKLDLPQSLGLTAFLDIDDLALVYVLPGRPNIARTPEGAPAVSLLVYRHKTGRAVFGGQLSITLDLRVDQQDVEHVLQWVDQARTPELPGEIKLPSATAAAAEWVSGRVHLQLADGVSAEGSPSMYADNTCALSMDIGSDQIDDFLTAWDDGLPEARATYEVSVRSAVQGGLSARMRLGSVSAQYESTIEHNIERNVAAAATRATTTPLTISGPIRLTAAELAAARTDFEL